MSHTQGRLKIDKFGGVIGGDKKRLLLHGLAINTGDREKNAVANARRLVACWNACEGVSTEKLETGQVILTSACLVYERQLQRDELLEALKAAIETAEFESHPFRAWHAQARAAISKAEGKV